MIKAAERSTKGKGAAGRSVSGSSIKARTVSRKTIPVEVIPERGTSEKTDSRSMSISTQADVLANKTHKTAIPSQKSTPVFSLRDIPGNIEDSAILNFLSKKEINWNHVEAIKALAGIDYITISNWLNIDVKTLRKWKSPSYKLKQDDKEKVLMLLILFKHGIKTFGTIEEFMEWLSSENFYFGGKKPGSYLHTASGVRFVDDNLTAIQYGDNA